MSGSNRSTWSEELIEMAVPTDESTKQSIYQKSLTVCAKLYPKRKNN